MNLRAGGDSTVLVACLELVDDILKKVIELCENPEYASASVQPAKAPERDAVGIGAYFPAYGVGVSRTNLLRPVENYQCDRDSNNDADEGESCRKTGTKHWSLLPGTVLLLTVMSLILCICRPF